MTVMRYQNFIFLPVNLLVYNKFLENMNNPFFDIYRKNRYDYRLLSLNRSDTTINKKEKHPVSIT